MNIRFDRFTLDNGLRVLVHRQSTSPVVAVNILYDVGAKHEEPEKTGFAHLFEHLMFEGSRHIPVYDKPLERVGGMNNAFTSNDFTNYYLVLPKENIETAFWLESDRLLQLQFSQEKLDIQKSVVIEEYKQRYLNQPYGDAWLHLKPLAYREHPYRWPVIGEDISHIENATMEEVKDFFNRFYVPENAILSVSGDVTLKQVKELANKWFAPIPARKVNKKPIPVEPIQSAPRMLELTRDVPSDMLFFAFHMPARSEEAYYAADMLSDILSNGKSARLHQSLVKKKMLFTDLQAWISGDIDPGLFFVAGRLCDGVSMEVARTAVLEELSCLCVEISALELEKVKNKFESSFLLEHQGVLSLAMGLGYYELLGDAELLNRQVEKYKAVSVDQLLTLANTMFKETNRSEMHYLASKKKLL